MNSRLRSFSTWYLIFVVAIWAYPLSIIFAKPFWSFLYLDLLNLPTYILRHFIGVGFLLLLCASGTAVLLYLHAWIFPKNRRRIRPHWTTHIAGFAALWIFYGTTVTLLNRQYPFIPLPSRQSDPAPGVSGHVKIQMRSNKALQPTPIRCAPRGWADLLPAVEHQ